MKRHAQSSTSKKLHADLRALGYDVTNSTKYDPNFCKAIIQAGLRGITFEEFASEIGVCLDSIYEWAEKYPEFRRAKIRAKQEMMNWMMKVGRSCLLGQRVGSKGKTAYVNTGMWIFMMKARFGWRDEGEAPDDEGSDVEFQYE